jgi:hypothetical protein
MHIVIEAAMMEIADITIAITHSIRFNGYNSNISLNGIVYIVITSSPNDNTIAPMRGLLMAFDLPKILFSVEE